MPGHPDRAGGREDGVPPPTRAELESLEVLARVNIPALENLLTGCRVREPVKGTTLIVQGQKSKEMFMILGGKLSVHLESPKSEALAFLQPGVTVGELSILDGTEASAYVVAAEDSRLLVVDEEAFWHLVNASHDFAINLLLTLVKRLRANNSTVASNIRLQQEYKREALIDGLTGIFNRRWLDEALPRLIARYEKSNEPMAVLMLDIDDFKKLNDTYGHPEGDKALVGVAEAIRGRLRRTDLAARYGGEEFIVLLPHTNLAGARLAAERLRVAVSELRLESEGGAVVSATVSIGGAMRHEALSPTDLVARADAALYASKHAGKNCVTFDLDLDDLNN